jgi:hypothetical protein
LVGNNLSFLEIGYYKMEILLDFVVEEAIGAGKGVNKV